MKKIAIALLMVAGSCYIFSACQKPDVPRKKHCQIRHIEGIYHNGPVITTSFITDYTYTNKRLLDSVNFMPNFSGGSPLNMKISYNNKGMPVEIRDNQNNVYKLIYQNGRVTRVDKLGTDNLFDTAFTLIYDSLGRIIEQSSGPFSATRWEYQANSRNYIRKLILFDLSSLPGLELYLKFEYQYDEKVNPMTTWPNTSLIPFYFELVENRTYRLEPIPENNWVYQAVFAPLRGFPLLFREYFYTYQYDDVFPVKNDFTTRSYTLDGVPGVITNGTTTFAYDCAGNVNF